MKKKLSHPASVVALTLLSCLTLYGIYSFGIIGTLTPLFARVLDIILLTVGIVVALASFALIGACIALAAFDVFRQKLKKTFNRVHTVRVTDAGGEEEIVIKIQKEYPYQDAWDAEWKETEDIEE